jgi:NAD(P)-dependent dehydrogenase (short-subunit alcohol dehydrogenase family)
MNAAPNGDGLRGYRSGLFAVTGGADGIGFALAERATVAGMRVAILDTRTAAATEAAARLRTTGAHATAYHCDVTEPESVASVAAMMTATGEIPSILWINAGVGAIGGFIGAFSADIEWVYQVNVLGAIRTARAFLPAMLEAEGPHHVGVTASSQSIIAADSVYGASKHATLAIGEALRAELAGRGIGVTLLIPGLTSTRIWNGARARPVKFGGPFELPDEFGEPWLNGLPASQVAETAFEAVAAGGGYRVLLPGEERIAQLENRIRDIRAALQVSKPDSAAN